MPVENLRLVVIGAKEGDRRYFEVVDVRKRAIQTAEDAARELEREAAALGAAAREAGARGS